MSRKTVAPRGRDVEGKKTDREVGALTVPAATGSGKTESLMAALSGLRVEEQRFALLLTEALRDVADETDISESRVRNLLYRLVQAGLLQERRASDARKELVRVLGPSLSDVPDFPPVTNQLDPVPYATVEQARRLAALRASLLRTGALSTAVIAEARGMTPNNARQWISRHRRSHRLFTVNHEGETLVPAFLLDRGFEPRIGAAKAIQALRESGEDGWALWAWFASPSAWLGGRVPAEVLHSDPELVAESARQRAASAA
jgi:hypothetical protein